MTGSSFQHFLANIIGAELQPTVFTLFTEMVDVSRERREVSNNTGDSQISSLQSLPLVWDLTFKPMSTHSKKIKMS